MSDEIKPALTAEEWDEPGVYGIGREEVDGDVDAIRVGIRVEANEATRLRLLVGWNENCDYPYESVIQGEKIAELVAIANHALPDGHPLKITRADVQMLRECVIRQQIGDDGTEWDRLDARREALAAKLAALLPPEG